MAVIPPQALDRIVVSIGVNTDPRVYASLDTYQDRHCRNALRQKALDSGYVLDGPVTITTTYTRRVDTGRVNVNGDAVWDQVPTDGPDGADNCHSLYESAATWCHDLAQVNALRARIATTAHCRSAIDLGKVAQFNALLARLAARGIL